MLLLDTVFILNKMGSQSSKERKEPDIDSFLQALKSAAIIDSKLYEATKAILTQLQNAEYHLIQNYFESKIKATIVKSEQSPWVCNRTIKKNEGLLYECNTCSYLIEGVYYCATCFSEQRHLGHDFRAIENQQGSCSCGNHQMLEEGSFCKAHFKNNTPVQPMDPSLKKELKFSLELLLFLCQDQKRLKLQENSYKYFGEPLLKYLLHVCDADRNNAYGVAAILLQKLDVMASSEVQLKSVGNNLLENLIVPFRKMVVIRSSLSELLNKLIFVDEIGVQLLRMYYEELLHKNPTSYILSAMSIKFDFRKCYRNQLAYFSVPANCRLIFTHKMQSEKMAKTQLALLYLLIRILLGFRNSAEIISNIMDNTKISELFRNYSFENSAQGNSLLVVSSSLACSIIRKIDKKGQLEAIIRDTLLAIIKKKGISFDLTQERAFALALYKYFGFQIPDKQYLMGMLCGLFPEFKSQAIELAHRYLSFRDLYHQEYEDNVRKGNDDSDYRLALLATDQLYFKIVCILTTHNGKPSELAKLFIARKIGDKKTENIDFVRQALCKFNIFFTAVNNSVQSNVNELIVSALHRNNKALDTLLGSLAIAYDGTNAADFKKIASHFAPPADVIHFIKEKLWLQGKKIHLKEEIKSFVVFSPFSEVITTLPAEIVLERMANIFYQSKAEIEDFKLFACDQAIKDWQSVLSVCLNLIEASPQYEAQVQPAIKQAFQHLYELGAVNKSKHLLALTHQFYKKIIPPLMQSFFKKFFESREKPEGEQSLKNNKKKQKLNEMKEKQKQMLQVYGAEQERRVEECIVCKNSRAGNPYLLANFGYKNIFSSVLKADTPFLEFSSCGHYIHEECLNQSHKGDFKIWYPCILCKSICNILLPNVSNAISSKQESREEQLGRVITFLKNLGGIYTFFYQDRAELIEFKLENVQEVFPLLFKTLVYQITFYPILNPQYFQRSQLPITKFLFDLLLFTSETLSNIAITKPIALKGDPLFLTLYQFISDQLSTFYLHKNKKDTHPDLPVDVLMIVQEIIAYLEQNQSSLEISIKPPKSYRDMVVAGFIKPPNDLRDLQSKAQECSSCQKIVTNYEKCLLCGLCYCQICNQVKKVHSLQFHLSESVFIRNSNGKYTYIHEELLGQFNSLYADYLGEECVGPQKANVGEFLISKQRWETVLDDLLNNRLHREIMKFQ